MRTITLSKIFRQDNPVEGALLNRIREGSQTDLDLRVLNERVLPKKPGSIILSPWRRVVKARNEEELRKLDTKEYLFSSSKTGTHKKSKSEDDKILLKKDCRIVIKSNDRRTIKGEIQEVVNGDTGVFLGLDKFNRLIIHRDRDQGIVFVKPKKRVSYSYRKLDDDTMEERETGSTLQYPIQLGYAMTMHSAQGSTLRNIHIELTAEKPFAPGLLYVALSRVPSFKSLTLSRAIKHRDIMPPKNLKKAGTEQYEL